MCEESEPIVDPDFLFELQVNEADHAASNLFFTWRLRPDTVLALQTAGIRFPFMLVVVSEKILLWSDDPSSIAFERVSFQFIRLDQGWGRVIFPHPGIFKISATIVCDKDENEGQTRQQIFQWLEKKLKERLPYKFDGSIVGYCRVIRPSFQSFEQLIEVVVADDVFAKEPPAWLGWWINLWYTTKPADECELRRRAINAFTLKPPAVLFFAVFAFAIKIMGLLVLLVFGWRHLTLRPFRQILEWSDLSEFNTERCRHDFGDGDFYGCWWVTDKNGEKQPRWWRYFTAPWVWLLAALPAVAWLMFPFQGEVSWDSDSVIYLWPCQYVMTAVFSLPVVLFLVLEARYYFKNWRTRNESPAQVEGMNPTEVEEAAKQAKKNAEAARLNTFYEKRLVPLIGVASEPRQAKLAAVPRSHRTISLYCGELKSRVCRPFRR